jgi:hypothetical protein
VNEHHSPVSTELKQALILASACHEEHLLHHKHVELSTTGIIYLGTPHQGSEKSQMMKAILGILSLVAPSNTHVFDALRPFEEFIQFQDPLYRSICNNYITYFCYETMETLLPDGSFELLVPQLSALMPEVKNAKELGIPRDHIQMSKFEGPDDGAFQVIAPILQQIVEEATATHQKRWSSFEGECEGGIWCVD